MLIFMIYVCLILYCIVFLYYPWVYNNFKDNNFPRGDINSKDAQDVSREDKIISIQNSLKDIYLENQIGKLSNSDFKALQTELLQELLKYKVKK